MRARPAEYELAAPGTLSAVLSLLAQEPGEWLPIAGGTDVMVQYSAGRLPSRKLVSIWNLPELRRIETIGGKIWIGAGCTYADLCDQEIVRREFSLLASAARWTGGIANQNRGTIGGNIANASPAGDSLPALMVYEATLCLVSARGERELPYLQFHQGYKKHALAPGELIRSISLPRQYSTYFSFARKVGARKAQAIAKVCIAALGKVERGRIRDARIALGSVAPAPLRLTETERLLVGAELDRKLAAVAAQSVARQIMPIDDIRSTTQYRAAVAANLVAEFVESLYTQAASQ